MSSNRDPPRTPSSAQSIPLQDLSRPPDPNSNETEWGTSRLRGSVSGRARALLGTRQSPQERRARYERVLAGPDETSQDESEVGRGRGERSRSHLAPLQTPQQTSGTFYDDGELSPLDIGEFQAAMGSVGLSFEGAGPSEPAPLIKPKSPISMKPQLGIIEESETASNSGDLAEGAIPDRDEYFDTYDDDCSPLTNVGKSQGKGSSGTTTPSARSKRSRMSRDRFSMHSSKVNHGMNRLGDDLAFAESGLRVPSVYQTTPNRLSVYSTQSISRSISSAGSPLSTAGSMLRKMSQRVVNLSNEPEVVEQIMRRQPSVKQARMDEPPSFPAMTEYINDEMLSPLPIEKAPPLIAVGKPQEEWQQQPNPLKGRSLGIFSPNSRLRLWLCEVLVHPVTEPVILVLIVIQTILLAVDAAHPLDYLTRKSGWGKFWIDEVLLGLFITYTLEIIAKIIVSGFIKNADEYSILKKGIGYRAAVVELVRLFFSLDDHTGHGERVGGHPNDPAESSQSIVRSFTTLQAQQNIAGNSRQQQRIRLARRAFMRHSFNRLDFLAVSSFWIAFFLAITAVEQNKHIWVFQMMSCLRILRLLGLTNGTSVILRSLKKAAPLLVNVAFLISFFWLLFAIIATQSFKGSFRRHCIWYGDQIGFVKNGSILSIDNSSTYVQDLAPANIQFCGGYLDFENNSAMPWLHADLKTSSDTTKGFLCPQRSVCVEGPNPYNGTVNFDNIFQSIELVFVIMSSNTFTDLLYYTTDSDYLLGALFFALAFVFMTLWLMNLLVAVITSSFQVIREESSSSAFTAEEPHFHDDDDPDKPRKKVPLKRAFDKTYWVWILIIAFGLIIQSLRTSNISRTKLNMINNVETVVTVILFVEILLRFAVDMHDFWRSAQNWIDLAIAIITLVIQIPLIRNNEETYAWLTFFQIIRIYRVVLAVPLTRDLLIVVFKNAAGLLNLIVFLFLMTFLVAIFAVQLFRGEFPYQDKSSNVIRITFNDIYNSFIGMYQVLSSENWTVNMYNASQYDLEWGTGWMGAIFFVLWFILANFIILNMFIAVIQESFDVSEDQKRLQQVKAFLQQREFIGSTQGTPSLATILQFGREKKRFKDPLDFGPATMEMFKEAVLQDFLDEQQMETIAEEEQAQDSGAQLINSRPRSTRPNAMLWSWVMKPFRSHEPNPFYTTFKFSKTDDELDPRTLAVEFISAQEQKKRAQRAYLENHPRYNMSLFLFKSNNKIRRFCQGIVGPGRGSQRVEGVEPIKPIWYTFSFFIYANVLAMVLIACVATPLFQRQWFIDHGAGVRNWFFWTDMGFVIVFTIEAVIKIIADGFFFTPNAWARSSWGFIDGIVLVTLWIDVTTTLFSLTGIARAVGAFKALRALRLLAISDSARDTFHSIIVLGGWFLQAAFVSLSLLIPFAIYGLNLFNGKLMICNDTSSNITNLSDCVGEWNSTPFQWNVLAPRQVSNPYYDFDNFGNSMFILFQIVSQEGWVDVMWSAMEATGRGLQPMPYASIGNSVFFIIFNLLGAVFVLTLFVSVFMRNITEQTGVAFLTAEQRSWLELRKLLRQISPSKRPSNKPHQQWKNFCYRIAVKKHGKWQRFITFILILHLALLVAEFYPQRSWWEITRDYLFLLFTVVYVVNIVIRIVGKTWNRFRRSSWDLYSLLAVSGTIIVSILDFSAQGKNHNYTQVHKFFLVSISLLLIPRNNQLDQLFKTAAASLGAISTLLATWFILFIVFAIALTQTLGLTRFGSQGKANLNFRNVLKALILLFRMSSGEGWNQVMEDFAQIVPPLCTDSPNFYDSDCGSAAWARTLFIAWNIVSMYIFVSMFVSLIFESFSYVYQQSSGLSMISRDEVRRFKEAWSTFDKDGSGWISKDNLPKLLGELSGVFEMRIYDGEHTVGSILEECRVEQPNRPGGNDPSPDKNVAHGVDIAKLNKRIASINVPEIRRRRARLELFSREVQVTADPDRGISFTSCLMILAHYNIITDKNSLRLEEFLRRRYRLQKVQEEVRLNVVVGFFDTLYWSKYLRRRRRLRHSARLVHVPTFNVPEIFVEDQNYNMPPTPAFPPSPSTPQNHHSLHHRRGSSITHQPPQHGTVSPLDTPRGGSPSRNAHALDTDPPSPHTTSFNMSPGSLANRHRGESFGSSPARSEAGRSAMSGSLQASSPVMYARRPSDVSERHFNSVRRPSDVSDRPFNPFSSGMDGPSSEAGGSRGPLSPGAIASPGMWTAGNLGSRHGRQISRESVVRRGSATGQGGGGMGLGGSLGVLDEGGGFNNTAWGESIKRSFTTRRRDRSAH
ncbi:calcium channel protein [Agyrium rufum]|nr:calcium channel protein [Agyrium rufum]